MAKTMDPPQGKPAEKSASKKAKPADPVLADAMAAMWKLLATGKPVFPKIAADLGLTPPQLHILRMLDEGKSLPMGQLAELLYCDASNVTALVDRMEERGLIERTSDPADRRVKRIALTTDGLKMRRDALSRLYIPPAGIIRLPAEDQRTLRKLLQKAAALHDDPLV